jgi:hypothetical protein
MTKVIAAVIILLILWGGWELFFYWERVKNEEVTRQQQAASVQLMGDALPGMPPQNAGAMETSLRKAKDQGAAGLKAWLKTYGPSVQDPRKAWIELDYCLLEAPKNPAEARRVFAEVKGRTPESSPVWPRIKELEKTFQ